MRRVASRSIAIPSICPASWVRDGGSSAALPVIEVQHHHAHLAACMAENGIDAGRRAGARHRARRARLGRRRHDLGRRIPARRLIEVPATGLLQAGGDAGRRAGDPRAVAQRLRAYRWLRSAGTVSRANTGGARTRPLSRRATRSGARGNDRAGRQCPARQFLRATVRCRCRRRWVVSRSRAVRGPGRDELEAAADRSRRATTRATRSRSRMPGFARTRRRCGRRCSTISPRQSGRRHRRALPYRPRDRDRADGRRAAACAAHVALSGGVFQNRLLLEQVTQRLAAQGTRC